MIKAQRSFNNFALVFSIFLLAVLTASFPTYAQQSGTSTLSGTVSLGDSASTVHGATVTIIQLKRTAYTDENGKYEFQSLTSGHYDALAPLSGLPDAVQSIDVTQGANKLDIALHLSGVKEQVTVTATGSAQAVSSS